MVHPGHSGCLEVDERQDCSPWDRCRSRLHSQHQTRKISGKSLYTCIYGKGRNRRHLSDKYSLRFFYIPDTGDGAAGKKEALPSPGLQSSKRDKTQVSLCSALLQYSPVEKVLLTLYRLLTQNVVHRQQPQHHLGAY